MRPELRQNTPSMVVEPTTMVGLIDSIKRSLVTSLLKALLMGVGVSLSYSAFAQDAVPTRDDIANAHGQQEFSPYTGRSFPTRVLFGDTHLHTAVSVDAGTMNRLGQEEAYRFARGEEVISTSADLAP